MLSHRDPMFNNRGCHDPMRLYPDVHQSLRAQVGGMG